MNQVNYMKLLSLLAFVAFAAVSCWATAESLHLLLPSWPVVLCWIVTIGFFVIASLGSKMIVDSMNPNIYQERRGLTLMGGLFLLLVFWLVCSMPTNTHTFFYRNSIGDITAQDIFTTKTYLQMLRDNVKTEAQIKARQDELRKELDNQETAFIYGAENFARKYNYPVLYYRVDKVRRGRYTVTFSLLCDKPQEVPQYTIVESYVRQLEADIKAKPEYWLWSHRRWKLKRGDNSKK